MTWDGVSVKKTMAWERGRRSKGTLREFANMGDEQWILVPYARLLCERVEPSARVVSKRKAQSHSL